MTTSTQKMTAGGKAAAVASFVVGKVQRLQNGLVEQQASWAKADAARLRRALGRPAGSVPEVWETTFGGLPENLVGRTGEPSSAESAVHSALCFYALHQQSRSTKMHQPGQGLGRALREFHNKSGAPNLEGGPLIRRINALSTADSIDEMQWHLRGIISQLRGAGIGLDYGFLARDLYRFSWPDSRDQVRRQWGRDFYADGGSSTEAQDSADTKPTNN